MKALSDIVSCLTTGQRELTCGACGNKFNCGASLSGCWCAEVKLNDEERAELKTKYRDCLCRECLEAVSRKS